jgi:hypothetical protein
MMTPSSDLFDLIQSMSAAERRAFTASIRKTGNADVLLLRVFASIAKQRKYDETAITELFGDAPIARNFAAYKHHLYGLVVRFLTISAEGDQKHPSATELMQQASILYQRVLYEQSYKMIIRARKAAERSEELDVLYRSFADERNLVVTRQTGHFTGEDVKDACRRIDGEIQRVIGLMAELAAVRDVQTRLFVDHTRVSQRFTSMEESRLWAESILSAPIMSDVSALGTDTAKQLWYHAHIIALSVYDNQYESAFSYAMGLVNLFENNPDRLRSFGLNYLRSVATASTIAIWVGRNEVVRDCIHKLRNGAELFGFVRTEAVNRFDLQSWIYEGALREDLLDISNLDAYVDGALDAIERYGSHERAYDEHQIHVYCISLLMIAERWDQAADLCATVLADRRSTSLYSTVLLKTMLCVLQILRGNDDLAESMATSCLRTIRKNPEMHRSSQLFHRMIRKWLSACTPTERYRLIQDYLCEEQVLVDEIEGHHQQRVYLNSPHIIWARAQAAHVRMVEAAQNVSTGMPTTVERQPQ